ncbi:hypothetical protein Tco_0238468 [Tanacetum coccineum]
MYRFAEAIIGGAQQESKIATDQYLKEVVSRHGVPISIISDRDGRFWERMGQTFPLIEFRLQQHQSYSITAATFERRRMRRKKPSPLLAEVDLLVDKLSHPSCTSSHTILDHQVGEGISLLEGLTVFVDVEFISLNHQSVGMPLGAALMFHVSVHFQPTKMELILQVQSLDCLECSNWDLICASKMSVQHHLVSADCHQRLADLKRLNRIFFSLFDLPWFDPQLKGLLLYHRLLHHYSCFLLVVLNLVMQLPYPWRLHMLSKLPLEHGIVVVAGIVDFRLLLNLDFIPDIFDWFVIKKLIPKVKVVIEFLMEA